MDTDDVPTMEVPCAAGARLHFDWGLGNKLEVCSTGRDAAASQYSWQCLDSSERRPALGIAPLFSTFHAQRQAGGNPAIQAEEVANYAERISECLIPDLTDEELPEDEIIIQLHQEKAVWELMRICFLSSKQDGTITEALAAWLRRNNVLYSSPEQPTLRSQSQELSELANPEDDSRYWQTVAGLTALGRVEEAIELLGAHSVWTTSYQSQQQSPSLMAQYTLVEAITMLIRRMPRLVTSATAELGGTAVADRTTFVEQRGVWQSQARELLQDQGLWKLASQQSSSTAQGVQQVAAILCSSLEAITEATSSWLDLLVAQLLHIYPDLQMQAHLGVLLHRCIEAKGSGREWCIDIVEQLLEAVGEGDLQRVMQVASTKLSAWVPAHLPDLLLERPSGAALQQPLAHLGCSQVEFFRLEYASALAAGATTWPLAAEYLAWCPQYGSQALKLVLENVSPTAEPKAVSAVLRICRQYGLPEVAVGVCRALGFAAAQEGRTAEALEWLLRAGETDLASLAAAPLLQRVQQSLEDTSTFSKDDSVVEELEDLSGILEVAMGPDGISESAHGTLSFLRAFLELQKYLQKRSSSDQAVRDAVLALLSSANFARLAGPERLPASMAVHILFLAIPLLEQNPPLFSFADSTALLQSLQQVQATAGNASKGAKRVGDALEHKLQSVQLALARQLARAHVQEAKT